MINSYNQIAVILLPKHLAVGAQTLIEVHILDLVYVYARVERVQPWLLGHADEANLHPLALEHMGAPTVGNWLVGAFLEQIGHEPGAGSLRHKLDSCLHATV